MLRSCPVLASPAHGCDILNIIKDAATPATQSISGLVAEYIVAIDVTRVRFPADALAGRSRVGMREIQVSASAYDHPTPAAQQPPHLQSTRALHGTLCVRNQKGTWCSGITSASHAEGPGFKSQCVHVGHHAPAFVGAETGAATGHCCASLANGAGTVHAFAREIYPRIVIVIIINSNESSNDNNNDKNNIKNNIKNKNKNENQNKNKNSNNSNNSTK
jgi:hypothetical protein